VIYLLECNSCAAQYVGETAQVLRMRMNQHRTSTNSEGGLGNFRMKQHFACSDTCHTFKIQVIQKLAGNGRIDVDNPKSKISPDVTKIRKNLEDSIIRKLYTMFPYGINDRIDSLDNKSSYNCVFSKFTSTKPPRKRSWSKVPTSSADLPTIADTIVNFYESDFCVSMVSKLIRIIFPLKQSDIILVRNNYFKSVFSSFLGANINRSQLHQIICDLFLYKIKPFIVSEAKHLGIKTKKRCIWKLDFLSKGYDMLNLPALFRDKELISLIPYGFKVNSPTICFSSVKPISKNVYNYNQFSKDYIDSDSSICVCNDPAYAEYVNNDVGHVATGNINIFRNHKLIEVVKHGPDFREPVSVDFDKLADNLISGLPCFIAKWALLEKVPVSMFNAWVETFKSRLSQSISELKVRYPSTIRHRSVFKDPDVITILDDIQSKFVICPVDKATKNFAIICKQYYATTIINELLPINGYSPAARSTDKIFEDITESNKRLDVNIKLDYSLELPHIVLYPKFHKPVLSQRFLVSYSNCFIKPFCQKVSLALNSVYNTLVSYSNMLETVTGIKHNYIIMNNENILSCIKDVNDNSIARNIQTYDFSTLYTKLSHRDIKAAMTSAVNLAFSRNKSKPFISVYSKSSGWVKNPRKTTVHFSASKLIEVICYIIDNSYFRFGELVFKQDVGIPIGVDPGPLLANLTLWYYEYLYISNLYKRDYASARKLNKTFRLIDDITSINSDGEFEKHCTKIYPRSLILNKENRVDTSADVLDLTIEINADNKFDVSVYDKRDAYKFNVIRFAPRISNIPERIGYGTFTSQILRYVKICNKFDSCKIRIVKLYDMCIILGYAEGKLKYAYRNLMKRHNLCDKFSDLRVLIQ